ncbi:hypothetical protein GON03_17065 [Nocardioides sp. MAH-18]|uniref:ARB-07466-like C-terminal domain-containing protein n=1 Tax=Nocardioides agri TaxID=2682843 RepID=A0A6L6XUM3_9ACTN|nr:MULTISPECIES: hypothetical protein [unclassified Nocardioides]MBA2956053.1 hypothetical protein [Nocardioides sp. CGMCC 1.13656]MVQ50899.1 hypothetical protein [Nocardioides sp. MAH-18]
MRIRTGVALVGLAAVGVAAVAGHQLLREVAPNLLPDECTATVDGRTVTLEPEQAENAALITAVAVGRGMPARAATIALATAYQESKLYNIDYGDRDSLGLFQQRPSQGWGSREELLDPVYATNAFYDGLVKVDGYEDMRITTAAQRVQRSAYPEAYADHEPDARVLASALSGNSPRAFSCRYDDDAEAASARLTASGLTRRADAVRRELETLFDPALGGFAPGGVSTGHMEGSAHYEGRAIDVFVRPVSAANKVRGWAIAQYLVAQADRLHLQTVIFDGRIWTSGSRSGDGWRPYDPPERAGDPAILEHRDHVHVDVQS